MTGSHATLESLAAALLLLLGCQQAAPREAVPATSNAPAAQIALPADLQIGLSRSRCYGTCPVYRVAIDGDGSVTYAGFQYVQVRKAEGHISLDAVRKLYTRFEELGFEELGDDFSEEVWDVSVTNLRLRANGHEKRLQLCWSRVPSPNGVRKNEAMFCALEDLARAIDETIDVEQWIGDPQWRATLRR